MTPWLAVAGVLFAGPQAPPTGITPSRPVCQAEPFRDAEEIRGSLVAGAEFSVTTPQGWLLRLAPVEGGWFLSLATRVRPTEDLSRLTPPLRGPNALTIEGWHLRNADNTGPNDGSVNVPGVLREFIFSPDVSRIVESKGTAITLEDIEQVRGYGRGWLFIDSYRLTPPKRGGRAAFEAMTFSACVISPDSTPDLELLRAQQRERLRKAESYVVGEESPDKRFEVRVFKDGDPEPSDYVMGIVERSTGRVITVFEEGGGYRTFSGVTSMFGANDMISALWHPSSRFVAITDSGIKTKNDLSLYEVRLTETGEVWDVQRVPLPPYEQNALGRLAAVEASHSWIRPIRWDGDVLESTLGIRPYRRPGTVPDDVAVLDFDVLVRIRVAWGRNTGTTAWLDSVGTPSPAQ